GDPTPAEKAESAWVRVSRKQPAPGWLPMDRIRLSDRLHCRYSTPRRRAKQQTGSGQGSRSGEVLSLSPPGLWLALGLRGCRKFSANSTTPQTVSWAVDAAGLPFHPIST